MGKRDTHLPTGRRICRTPRCGNVLARAWSPYCSACRSRNERMGHPEQRSISPRVIAPYLASVRRGIRRLPKHLRDELDLRIARRVAILAEYCQGLLDPGAATDTTARSPMQRASAAFLSRALRSENVTPSELVLDTCARALHLEDRPAAYKSDRAFGVLAIQSMQRLARVYVTFDEWNGSRGRYARRRQRKLALTAARIASKLWLECVAELYPLIRQVTTRHDRLLMQEAKEREALRAEIAALPDKPQRTRGN
jgi:hypothetical protein